MLVQGLAVLFLVVAPVPDPLGPSREGWIACVDPDQARKTCMAITRYRWIGQKILYESEMLIDDQPFTILHARTVLEYRGAAVCSWTQDIGGEIVGIAVEGENLPAEALDLRRREIAARMKDLAGVEYCVTYEPGPDGTFLTQVSIEGVRSPASDNTMIWVRPDDGWTVAP